MRRRRQVLLPYTSIGPGRLVYDNECRKRFRQWLSGDLQQIFGTARTRFRHAGPTSSRELFVGGA